MVDKKLLMSVLPGETYVDEDAHVWNRHSHRVQHCCCVCEKPIGIRDEHLFSYGADESVHLDCVEVDVPAKFFEAYRICASEEVIEDG